MILIVSDMVTGRITGVDGGGILRTRKWWIPAFAGMIIIRCFESPAISPDSPLGF